MGVHDSSDVFVLLDSPTSDAAYEALDAVVSFSRPYHSHSIIALTVLWLHPFPTTSRCEVVINACGVWVAPVKPPLYSAH